MVKQYSMFALAGAIPFVAAAFAVLFGVDTAGPVQSVIAALLSYGLVIVSFVAGSHWGIYLQNDASAPVNLFITGNVLVLVPWLAFVLGSINSTLLALIMAFAFLLVIDWRLLTSGLIDKAYFRLRAIATLFVCSALLTVVLAR